MNGIITSQDFLVLRDGRPFGADLNASGYNWPLPQTVAGMLRTALGHAQDDNFFTGPGRDSNISRISKVSLKHLLPYVKDVEWKPLFPVPSDLEFYQKNDLFEVKNLSYVMLASSEGTDIVNRDWLVGINNKNEKEKTSGKIPKWLNTNFLIKYVLSECNGDVNPIEIGFPGPICETRMHNGIEPVSFSVEESKLFSNYGFYLHTKNQNGSFQLGIGFSADTAGFGSFPNGDAFLGGERRVITVENHDLLYPERPRCLVNQHFLKILLLTHGDFGSWCPQWLCPSLESSTIDWVTYPGSNIELRLRSAIIKGWDAVSGWDYKLKKPKAMKKLVKPGSVYLIEMKKPSDSDKLSEILWGNTLAGGLAQSDSDGYNQVITALHKTDTKKD